MSKLNEKNLKNFYMQPYFAENYDLLQGLHIIQFIALSRIQYFQRHESEVQITRRNQRYLQSEPYCSASKLLILPIKFITVWHWHVSRTYFSQFISGRACKNYVKGKHTMEEPAEGLERLKPMLTSRSWCKQFIYRILVSTTDRQISQPEDHYYPGSTRASTKQRTGTSYFCVKNL